MDIDATGFHGDATKREPIDKLRQGELRSSRRDDISYGKDGAAAVRVVENVLDWGLWALLARFRKRSHRQY